MWGITLSHYLTENKLGTQFALTLPTMFYRLDSLEKIIKGFSNFVCGARVLGQTNLKFKVLAISGNSKHFSFNKKNNKNRPLRGGLQNFLHLKSYLLVSKNPVQDFRTLR